MKLGFASRWSPHDKRSWSGTIHYAYQQIQKRYPVEVFEFNWNWLLREWLTSQKSINRRFYGKQTSVEFLRSYAKFFSRKLSAALRKQPVDALFVPASSQFIAYAETEVPILYMTDASFLQLQGYYPGFSNLPKYNVRQGIDLDRAAFQKAEHCLLASEWCKSSVVKDYGIDPRRITVAPCGANLDEVPDVQSLRFKKTGDQCELLFLGVDWERKGGEIVLEAYRLLKNLRKNVRLHIIGCKPPQDLSGDNSITVIPFLDKNKKEDLQRLKRILSETDLLFLPTRAECAGVVFSEASAFGVPSVTTDTGGVRTYVQNGVNGFTLPIHAGAEAYASLIASLMGSQNSIQDLRASTRQYYDRNLSWDLWGEKFNNILAEIQKNI